MSHFIYCYAECHHAECRILFTVMLSVIMLNVVMLSVEAPSMPIPRSSKARERFKAVLALTLHYKTFYCRNFCKIVLSQTVCQVSPWIHSRIIDSSRNFIQSQTHQLIFANVITIRTKKFYKICHRTLNSTEGSIVLYQHSIKKNYVRNFRMFVISQSIFL